MTLRPTRLRDVLLIALTVGVVSWLLIRQFYGDLPPLRWYTGAWLAVLAVVEFIYGRQLRARIRREPGALPVQALATARAAVFGKASAILGGLMAGVWGGLLAYVLPELDYLAAAGHDAVTGSIGLVAAAGLAAAGLWLEYCCRAPDQPDDSDRDGLGRA